MTFLHRALSILAVALVATTGALQALAAPSGVNASAITITHSPGVGSGVADDAVAGFAPVLPLHTDFFAAGAAPGFSTAAGAAAPIFSPNLFGMIVPSGTGINQSDPNFAVAASSLVIDFEIDFQFDAGGFPLGWVQFMNFPLFTFAGPGDTVTFSVVADFVSQANGLIGPGLAAIFINAGAGAIFTNVSQAFFANQAIPANDVVKLIGSIIFTADNPASPAEIFLVGDGGISVPTPASLPLLVAGLGILGLIRRQRAA